VALANNLQAWQPEIGTWLPTPNSLPQTYAATTTRAPCPQEDQNSNAKPKLIDFMKLRLTSKYLCSLFVRWQQSERAQSVASQVSVCWIQDLFGVAVQSCARSTVSHLNRHCLQKFMTSLSNFCFGAFQHGAVTTTSMDQGRCFP
jgi:hypothetical protein